MKRTLNGTIQLGLVTIPVGVASTISAAKAPSFRTLHDKCHQPIEVRTPNNEAKKSPTDSLNWCPTCDEEVEEVEKGFEFAKGQFVVFTESELELLNRPRDPIISVSKFIKFSEIKPAMIASSHWLMPGDLPRMAELYGVLYQSLAEMKMAGFATQSLWGKEHPCVIVPNQDYIAGGVLQLLTLHPFDDLNEPDFAAPVPGREEKKKMKGIIQDMTDEFTPMKDLVSASRRRVETAIASRIEGAEIDLTPPDVVGTELDPMKALEKQYKKTKAAKYAATKGKARA